MSPEDKRKFCTFWGCTLRRAGLAARRGSERSMLDQAASSTMAVVGHAAAAVLDNPHQFRLLPSPYYVQPRSPTSSATSGLTTSSAPTSA
eukprot:XP_001689571.1 predicted protein [Chlamydomonas reinhardtii]